jgi:glutathione S-transferase
VAYALFYWPEIQGRGEFVRLALEYASAAYRDVSREDGGTEMARLLRDADTPAFAPPFLRADGHLIGQTANILLYLGRHHATLAPRDEAARLWLHQVQLTIADLVQEVHDTHHPVGSGLYYEDQRPEAVRRAADFRAHRLPKFFGWFERLLAAHGDDAWLLGDTPSYGDLSLFQIVAGLRYGFPRAMRRLERRHRHLHRLHDRVAALPSIAAYLDSPRRIAFNQDGIFRHYDELDDPG